MASYLITGASRGLGFELTRLLAALPASEVSKVFATIRKNSPKLNELAGRSDGRVVVVKPEVTDKASVKQAAVDVEANLAGKGLDVLINNVGMMRFIPEGTPARDNLGEVFANNVLGVHVVIHTFLPLLQKGNLKKSQISQRSSSIFGSISSAPSLAHAPIPAYKIFKTALNALTVQYAIDCATDGFTFFALHPGIRTDLGGEAADLSAEEGGKASLGKVLSAGKEQNGTFVNIYVEES